MWPAVPIPGQWAYVLAACVLLLFAAGAFGRGWFFDRSKGRPRCRRCGYPVVPGNARDVTEAVERAAQQRSRSKHREPKPSDKGTTSGGGWSCPECGWSPRRVKDLTRTRRSCKWLAVSVFFFLGACASWYTIHVQYRRITLQEPLPTAMTPTTWWIAVLPHHGGDADLTVYYRTYPQARIAAPVQGTVSYPLIGSGRLVSLMPMQGFGRDAGWRAIPRWQVAWAASRCRAMILDTSRPEDERADAAWLFAELSTLSQREHVEALTGVVAPGDDKLTTVVFQELYDCEIAPDVYAAMAARVIEDDRYAQRHRDRACKLLAQAGPEAEPYLLAWIAGSDQEKAYFVALAIRYSIVLSMTHGQADFASINRVVNALLTSPYLWNISLGIQSLDYLRFAYFRNITTEYEQHLTFRPAIEPLFQHGNRGVVRRVIRYAFDVVEKLQYTLGKSDPRVIETWAWLLRQPDTESRVAAAEALREIAERVSSVIEEHRAARQQLRPILEEGLRINLDPVVRDRLEAAIEWLDIGDARADEWDAEQGDADMQAPAAE